MIWDATVTNTLANSYISTNTHDGPKGIAAKAELNKSSKFSHLPHDHIFSAIAIETLGAFGPRTIELVKKT